MDAVFATAVREHGPDYLDAERQLLDGGPAAQAVLRGYLDHSDPIGRMIARQLLDRMEGRAPDVAPALAYLDGLPARIERTPLPAPPPSGVAIYLSEHFQARVADFLALRLVKETQAPHWRVLGILLYLRQQALPSTSTALVRFAADTRDETRREAAVAAIQAIDDPALQAKLLAERERAQQRGDELPHALSSLIRHEDR